MQRIGEVKGAHPGGVHPFHVRVRMRSDHAAAPVAPAALRELDTLGMGGAD